MGIESYDPDGVLCMSCQIPCYRLVFIFKGRNGVVEFRCFLSDSFVNITRHLSVKFIIIPYRYQGIDCIRLGQTT